MSLYDRLQPDGRAEPPAPPAPRLGYYLVRLHGGEPGPTGNAIDEEGASLLHARLLHGAPAGSQICTYINERPATLDEVRAAIRSGDPAEAEARLDEWLAAH
jgi:hypothetical protein